MKVRKQSIDQLMTTWETFANEYIESEDSIFEWQNYMDARRLIEGLLESTSDAKKGKIKKDLKAADLKVLDQTFEINECVWNKETESKEGYNRHHNWYYYRLNQGVFDTEPGQFTKR